MRFPAKKGREPQNAINSMNTGPLPAMHAMEKNYIHINFQDIFHPCK